MIDPKRGSASRRLHPKLRVVQGGDANVNDNRAHISTTVASQKAAFEGIQLDSLESMVRAQVKMRLVDTSDISTPLQRTPVGTGDIGSATDSFVNVFIEVPPGTDEESMNAIQSGCKDWVKDSGAIPGATAQRGNIVSATLPVTELDSLENDPRVAFVERCEPLHLDVPASQEASAKPKMRKLTKSKLHGDGENVLIGIIDVGGFDFSHPDFLTDGGDTRFLSIWDQGSEFRDAPKDKGFGYGAEFRRDHLNQALKDSKTTNIPPTRLEPQSQQSEASHATHVASIAAGNRGVCPKADIAAVLIDVPLPDDETDRRKFSFSDSSRIVHAVEYLLNVAEEQKKPISINISLGTNGGAHDGSNGVCRWLDNVLSQPGRAITIAAGNAGQEGPSDDSDIGWVMGRIHTSGQVASRGLEVELEWVVVGNGIVDLSENELEIWYSPQDRFSVAIKPPNEDKWYDVQPQEFRRNHELASGTRLSMYNELFLEGNGANYISIYLSPNLEAGAVQGIKAGVWKVRLRGEEVRDGRFHAWIERDDPVEIGRTAHNRFFRFPSFFSEKSNVDSHSISSLACARFVVAVANTDSANSEANITSSQGPTRDGRLKPDIAANGSNVVAAKGFSQDNDEWVSMSGTSMASPYVAGVIGLMLATNPELSSAQCAGILQRTSQPLPGHVFDWRNDTGFGEIRAQAAVEEANGFTQRSERR